MIAAAVGVVVVLLEGEDDDGGGVDAVGDAMVVFTLVSNSVLPPNINWAKLVAC